MAADNFCGERDTNISRGRLSGRRGTRRARSDGGRDALSRFQIDEMEGRLKAMKEAPRILVLTLSFGSGHVRAALAVAEELKRLAPRAEVKVLDALENSHALFRALYVWPYLVMVRYAPALWKRFFKARVKRRHAQTAPAWAFRSGCPEVFAALARFRPEAIVACEVAACEMAVIARRARLTEARIINVITDHEAEPIWVKEEVCS